MTRQYIPAAAEAAATYAVVTAAAAAVTAAAVSLVQFCSYRVLLVSRT